MHERGLVVLAVAFLLVAAPVAWEWRWVTIAWGVGELPTVALMLMVLVDWYRRDTRDAVLLTTTVEVPAA